MPTARLPIDAAHRAATADAHAIGAVTGLQAALDAGAAAKPKLPKTFVLSGSGSEQVLFQATSSVAQADKVLTSTKEAPHWQR